MKGVKTFMILRISPIAQLKQYSFCYLVPRKTTRRLREDVSKCSVKCHIEYDHYQ